MKGQLHKKVVIGLVTLGIVGGLGLSVYTTKHMNDEPVSETKKEQLSEKKETKQKEKPEEVVILNPLDGKDSEPVEDKKKEIKSYEVTTTEQEVRELFRNFKFEEGTNILDEYVFKYELKGDAEILKNLHHDGALLMNLVPHDDHGGHTENAREGVAFEQGIINVMNGFKDPENALLGTLHLDHETREHVIVYDGSLNPVFEEGREIRVIEKTTVDIPHEIKVMYPETVTYHKMTFILDTFTLEAYVTESSDGKISLYTIEDPSKQSHYYTITQWKKIHNNIEKGLPAFEGVIEVEVEVETETPSDTEDENTAPEETTDEAE